MDYTFAVRDNTELKVVAKAYSGITNGEILQLTYRAKSIIIQDEGYRILVRPEVVLEISFAGI